jgi:hypothetical protein
MHSISEYLFSQIDYIIRATVTYNFIGIGPEVAILFLQIFIPHFITWMSDSACDGTSS